MDLWNIGNTTVRNPSRLREALILFVDQMSGRTFTKTEQSEYQNHLIDKGLVNSERRTDGDDGGRKFASAFKQLGFVTDWARGQAWNITPVGRNLIEYPNLESTIFLRQLLKYQIPSPLENVQGLNVRPFRLLLRFLKQAHDEGMVGLTKYEIGLFVQTTLTEDAKDFENAFDRIRIFRVAYNAQKGKVVKNRYATQELQSFAQQIRKEPGTLLDYADSNSRYMLLSGLLIIRGNKLALAPSRLPFIEQLLSDNSTLLSHIDYLTRFYDSEYPPLPTDDTNFLIKEIPNLLAQLNTITKEIGEVSAFASPPTGATLTELQNTEQLIRRELKRVREVKFYREQASASALQEIEDYLDDINDGTLLGGLGYAPAFFEWAVWRLFLAMNSLQGDISKTRGFEIDDEMLPIHHARGGAADLTFVYADFVIVCEMTLAGGSRQFAMEGEPVTRHVFKAIKANPGKPVYGVFAAKKLDPNTSDAFHQARYWEGWNKPVDTPVVAFEMEHLLHIVQQMRRTPLTPVAFRTFLDGVLSQQTQHQNGPDWFTAYAPTISKLI